MATHPRPEISGKLLIALAIYSVLLSVIFGWPDVESVFSLLMRCLLYFIVAGMVPMLVVWANGMAVAGSRDADPSPVMKQAVMAQALVLISLSFYGFQKFFDQLVYGLTWSWYLVYGSAIRLIYAVMGV